MRHFLIFWRIGQRIGQIITGYEIGDALQRAGYPRDSAISLNHYRQVDENGKPV